MNYHTETKKAIEGWAKAIELDHYLLEARTARDVQWSVLAPYVLLKTSPPQEEIARLMECQRKIWEIENQIKDLHKTTWADKRV